MSKLRTAQIHISILNSLAWLATLLALLINWKVGNIHKKLPAVIYVSTAGENFRTAVIAGTVITAFFSTARVWLLFCRRFYVVFGTDQVKEQWITIALVLSGTIENAALLGWAIMDKVGRTNVHMPLFIIFLLMVFVEFGINIYKTWLVRSVERRNFIAKACLAVLMFVAFIIYISGRGACHRNRTCPTADSVGGTGQWIVSFAVAVFFALTALDVNKDGQRVHAPLTTPQEERILSKAEVEEDLEQVGV